MKFDMDAFVDALRQRNAKRRRIAALLLTLSLVVSSGVSWALHGVGMTMVNEAICETEEHIHSDACYEKVLGCGLEEDETHMHTDACYDRVLICGQTEHTHSAACYTEEPLPDTPEPEDENELLTPDTVIIAAQEPETAAEPESAENAEPAAPEADAAEAESADNADNADYAEPAESGADAEAAGEPEESGDSAPPVRPALMAPAQTPGTIETIDNIAAGIHFNLFDYGNAALEQDNNYDYSVKNGVVSHPNVNSTDGINAGRNPDEDIMFFAYGTPHRYEEWVDGAPNPGINNYSGDYNANHTYSGNRPVQGIVADSLDGGYPKIASSQHSLDYLFDPEYTGNAADARTVYKDVNFLLQDWGSQNANTLHLGYNSNNNYAYFNQETNNFEVYNKTFDIISSGHHKAGDIDYYHVDSAGNPVKYDTDKDPGFKIGFFPFDPYDESRRDPNFDGVAYNHHFGMTMDATFKNLPMNGTDVTEPITFKYSGDDDMWVFLDGDLALDLGGIHEPTGGMLDFTNNLMWYQDNGKGNTLAEIQQQLGLNDEAWAKLPKPIGIDTASTSTDSGTRWFVSPIWEDPQDQYKEHTINMFYLERGGCFSNLAMEMNLPTVKPLSVIKDVDYGSHLTGDYDNDTYNFQLYEWLLDETDNTYKWLPPAPILGMENFDGSFSLKAGERLDIPHVGEDRIFKVVETGVDPNIYSEVDISDGNTHMLTAGSDKVSVESGGHVLRERNAYTFTNKVREEKIPLSVRKEWEPAGDAQQMQDYNVQFKIYQNDGEKESPVAIELTEGGKQKLKRTFSLNKGNSWTWSTEVQGGGAMLPSRYGSRIYTYSVKEQNTPMNYTAVYSEDGGTKVITNVNINNVNIYVRKIWENQPNPPQVELILKRRYKQYVTGQSAKLQVIVCDKYSYQDYRNVILSETIEGLHEDGSVEFSLRLPEGVTIAQTVDKKSPDTLNVRYEDGFYEVSNLSAGDNLLQLRVDTEHAEDSILTAHHTFTSSTQGWQGIGSTQLITSGNNPYAGHDALVVTNCSGDDYGAKLHLDPAEYIPGKSYTFSVYVRGDSADQFKMVFNNGKGADTIIAETTQTATGWKHLMGTIKIPANSNPYDMSLRVESKNHTAGIVRIDEFAVVEGRTGTLESGTDGRVTIGPRYASLNQETYSIDFKNSLTDGWTKNGNGNAKIEYLDGAIRFYDRRGNSDSITKQFGSLLQAGHTYRFELGTQHDGAPADAAGKAHLILHYYDTDNRYKWLCNKDIPYSTSDEYQYCNASETFEIPANANLNNSRIYFETEQNDTKSFRVRYLRITDITNVLQPNTEPKAGYTIDGSGNYVTDYSNYDVDFDLDSITAPMHLTDEAEDEPFSRTVILTGSEQSPQAWMHHWDKDDLDERNDRRYEYYIAGETIRYADGTTTTVLPADAEGNLLTADGNYLVRYSRQDVASNTENSPITVTNKYIWYKLPPTGGIGTDLIFGAGAFLAVFGFIGGYALRKRERRYPE